jgi:hypothetical protein
MPALGRAVALAACLAAAAAVALAPGSARAQPAPALDASLRAAALEATLDSEERRFAIWRWSWTAAYGVLTLGSLALVPSTPRADRVDLYTGAVTSALAIAPPFLFPQPVHRCPPGPGRLACSQAALDQVAAFQREGRGLLMHAINVAYNALAAGFLAIGYGRWRSAALTFAGGFALGELQIFTQPQGAARLQDAIP